MVQKYLGFGNHLIVREYLQCQFDEKANKLEDGKILYNEWINIISSIIEEKSNAMVGKVFDVLVEGVSKKNSDVLSGYNQNNKLVNFKGDPSLIGKIVNVKIIESHTYSLIGELVSDD